jgi:hypothetical protein
MENELSLVKQLSDEGKTSELLFLAVERGRISSISTILKTAPELISTVDEKGRTPLAVACESGHVDVIRALLASNAPCCNGEFHVAVSNGTSTEPFQTALLQAVCSGDDRRCIELVKGGVDPNSHHALCWAADLGHNNVVIALLEASADVNLPRSSDGKTALHLAINNKNQDIVKTLLSAESDITSKDTNGVTPKELATKMGLSLMRSSNSDIGGDGRSSSNGDNPRSQQKVDADEINEILKTKCLKLERELEEQKNLVSGLRDMLNTVLSKDGTQKLVQTLQSELQRVKAEGRLLAESSFRKLKASRDEKIERMCSSLIEEEDKVTEEEEEDSGSSTFGYLISILGLQGDRGDDY